MPDNHLKASIEDVNSSGKYDFLIICLDFDEASPETTRQLVHDFIQKHEMVISCPLQIIVQSKCMETWFMDNRTVYPRNPSQNFKSFSQFYNVSINDPERMEKPQDFEESQSLYHYEYLKAMLSEKNMRYSKKKPREVMQESYLKKLRKRTKDFPEQLATLKIRLNFLEHLNKA